MAIENQIKSTAFDLSGVNFSDYLELTKPKVVALIVFTAIVGMFLSVPGWVPWDKLIFGTLGIGLASASAAAINHLVDQHADSIMGRTSKRPLPRGSLSSKQVIYFALTLGVISMAILVAFVNPLTAILTFASLIGYAVVYTLYLKRATPQNIVIGGAAGAMPPVLGWVAVTNDIHPNALLLFLIIFVWTPPHFWSLAIHRFEDYSRAGIPMLPVTHGIEFTRLHILLYTILLCAVTLMPVMSGLSGMLYLVCTLILNAGFLYYAVMMKVTKDDKLPIKTFRYSIYYLTALFAVLLVDHYIPFAI